MRSRGRQRDRINDPNQVDLSADAGTVLLRLTSYFRYHLMTLVIPLLNLKIIISAISTALTVILIVEIMSKV